MKISLFSAGRKAFDQQCLALICCKGKILFDLQHEAVILTTCASLKPIPLQTLLKNAVIYR
jgi:hypothetical protein